MRVIHTKVIDCSAMAAAACSDLCLAALGHGPNFLLRTEGTRVILADNTVRIDGLGPVHGAVTIAHNLPPALHEIWVDVYEQDEGPTKERRSTLRRPVPMPTDQAIRDRLNAWAL